MKFITNQRFYVNCFMLTIPVLLWNIVLSGKLPESFQPVIFWNNIPEIITYGENIFRTLVFLYTFMMPMSFPTNTERKGLTIYVAGVVLYFSSWIVLIYFPTSIWSTSIPGFMAPAYTPLLWLTGIGLIGNSLYFSLPYKRWHFFILAIVFLAFHNIHTYIIYCRIF
jgi:hypothetical protein